MSIFGTDYDGRKAVPIFDGAVMYFPKALAAVAHVSVLGNQQHNPGEPLHWARGKSNDQRNTALRHMIDHAAGERYDTDGARHLAKAAWRILAALELDIEAEQKTAELAAAAAQAAAGAAQVGEGAVDRDVAYFLRETADGKPHCGDKDCPFCWPTGSEAPFCLQHQMRFIGDKCPRCAVAEQGC